MKTNELTGAALDWAVARCEGEVSDDIDDFCLSTVGEFAYSETWVLGGPIIEREGICIGYRYVAGGGLQVHAYRATSLDDAGDCTMKGPTPLVAAMRCYVASKLGDDVEIPEELK